MKKSTRYVNVKDLKALKLGMRVKCCLDVSEVIDHSDDGDSSNPDDWGWFTGVIRYKNGTDIQIQRDNDGPNNRWSINLRDEDLFQYIMVEVENAWDE